MVAALVGMAAAATVAVFGAPVGEAVADSGTALMPSFALQSLPDTEVVFLEQCAPCHGSEGEGGVGPALISSTIDAADRLELIRNGRDAMPGFGATLSDAAIEALSTLLARQAATTTYEQQCAPCHGASGEGGIGPLLTTRDVSYEAARLVIARGERAMPAFEPTLTEDQLDGVTLFVQHLAQIQVGSELYARLCTACHGDLGEGGTGPALTDSDVTAAEIDTIISAGGGAMPAFGSSLDATDLEAVITFTRRLVAGQVVSQPAADGGADLYLRLCAACHGGEGEGGTGGPPLMALGLSDAELSTLIAEGQGGMPGFGSDLADADVVELVAYVQSSFGAAPDVTGEDLYGELCAVCHGVEGEGGAGPPLTAMALSDDELSTVIAAGQGSMPGFADQLSAEGVADLVEYLAAAFGGEDSSTTTTPAVPVLSGLDMFVVHCATCHAADGSGGLGPDLRDFDLSLNEVISRIYGGHADGMPAFEGELTGLEVQELARYVTTLFSDPDDDGSGASVWVWPVVGLLMLAGLAGFLFLRRSRSPKAEVLPRGSE